MKQPSVDGETTYWIDDDQTAAEAVLDAIAERAGVDLFDLSVPLYDAVDPDALDAFYRTCAEGNDAASVTFSYYGYEVRVSGRGDVVVDG